MAILKPCPLCRGEKYAYCEEKGASRCSTCMARGLIRYCAWEGCEEPSYGYYVDYCRPHCVEEKELRNRLNTTTVFVDWSMPPEVYTSRIAAGYVISQNQNDIAEVSTDGRYVRPLEGEWIAFDEVLDAVAPDPNTTDTINNLQRQVMELLDRD